MFRRRREAGLCRPVKIYTFNEDFFGRWSADLAWVLGLIWSDGNLKGNSIDIASKDRDLLETVASLIGHNIGPVGKNRGRHHRLHFSSPTMATWLRDLGLHENKSLTVTWPSIPAVFEGDFLRGVIDGDGHIGLRTFRPGQQVADLKAYIYTASPEFRDGIMDCLGRHGISCASHRTNIWCIQVFRQAALRSLYSLIYHHDDVPCLKRKYTPFHQWFTTPRARPGRPCRPINIDEGGS